MQQVIEIIDYGTTKDDLIPGAPVMYAGYLRTVFLVGKFFASLKLDINIIKQNRIYSQYEIVPIKNIQIIKM